MSPVLFLLAAAQELLDSGKDEISDITTRNMEPRCLFVDVFKSTSTWNLVESTCRRWKKVEVPQSMGCNKGVRRDEEGEEADYREGGEEDAGAGRDCPLHQGAVGGRFGVKGYWGKYR